MRNITRNITSALSAALSSSGWLVLALLAALWVGLVARPAAGNSQQVSFRLSRLESEVRSLQSQVNQLGGQVDRQRRSSPVSEAPIAAPAPEPALDYDRLATLVIETRQDVFALQEQLSAIEARLEAQGPGAGP